MHFAERVVHDCRVYAGAMETDGGYTAGVVVKHQVPGTPATEIFHDAKLAFGYRWSNPNAALRFALDRGVEVARQHVDKRELDASEIFLKAACEQALEAARKESLRSLPLQRLGKVCTTHFAVRFEVT